MLLCGAIAVVAPARAEIGFKGAYWHFVLAQDAPKLMLAVPDDFHPVFVFMYCRPEAGTVTIVVFPGHVAGGTADALGHLDESQTFTLSLHAGRATFAAMSAADNDGPDGGFLELHLSIRDPFWTALAASRSLIVQSSTLARPVTLGLRTMPQPLRRFRAACAAR
jgi:hypothetical protein